MMYKRTPFRDRDIDAMKRKEPESTMSTDGEPGGGLFPKAKKRRQERKANRKANREERRAERGRGEISNQTATTRRSEDNKEDFEMYIEEGGATTSRPENEMGMTRRGLRDRIRRIRQGGSTGLIYGDDGNPLFGRDRRQVIKERIKKARQDYRNQP